MKTTLPKSLNARITKYSAFLAIISFFSILLLAACGDNPTASLAQPPTVTPISSALPDNKAVTTVQVSVKPATQSVATVAENATTIVIKKETAIAEATLTKIAEPTTTPTPTLEVNTPFCRASDFSVTDGLQGATGSLSGSILFTNKSSSSCYLQGYPQIQIENDDGQMLPLQYAFDCLPCTNPNITDQQRQATVTASGLEKIMLPPGRQAVVMVVWRNWCGKDKLNNLQFVVTLPNKAGKLTVPIYEADGQMPLQYSPRCDAPNYQSGFGIGAFHYPQS